mgnify:FL=1
MDVKQESDLEPLCSCANLTYGDARKLLARPSGMTYDQLLAETGAGQTCTACLLNMEYFCSSEGAAAAATGLVTDASLKAQERRSLKLRLYDWLDTVFPLIAFNRTNFIPILCGPDIETNLRVTNHKLLFKEGHNPPFKIRYAIRNAAGGLLKRNTALLGVGEELNVPVSTFLDPPEEGQPFSIGMVEIDRFGKFPGNRGTTRPQVEILSKDGSSAVHSQAYNSPGDIWFTAQNRIDEERLFVIVLNASRADLVFSIAYPFSPLGVAAGSLQVKQETLAGKGAYVHEVTGIAPDELVYSLRAQIGHAAKVMLLCATPDLSRISVDHP